jgi:hypothetical protein
MRPTNLFAWIRKTSNLLITLASVIPATGSTAEIFAEDCGPVLFGTYLEGGHLNAAEFDSILFHRFSFYDPT